MEENKFETGKSYGWLWKERMNGKVDERFHTVKREEQNVHFFT